MPASRNQLPADVPKCYSQECARLRPFLIRVAARRCIASVDPEDIAQEAIVRGAEYRRLDMGQLPQFLVAMVTRLCSNEVRRIVMAHRMVGHPRLLPPPTVAPAEFACDRAEAQWFAARLVSFSLRDRKLVSMLATGWARPEIARELGITLGSTYSAIQRIRSRIRRRYL
jgi:DNA-directed RNA polymerase specialized sigma24 family protein